MNSKDKIATSYLLFKSNIHQEKQIIIVTVLLSAEILTKLYYWYNIKKAVAILMSVTFYLGDYFAVSYL